MVKHAHAHAVWVTVVVTPREVSFTVADDGRGQVQELDERSGLANLRRRAERHRGTMQLRTTPPDGITLAWSVPLDRPPG